LQQRDAFLRALSEMMSLFVVYQDEKIVQSGSAQLQKPQHIISAQQQP
jgi:hypothetical protein